MVTGSPGTEDEPGETPDGPVETPGVTVMIDFPGDEDETGDTPDGPVETDSPGTEDEPGETPDGPVETPGVPVGVGVAAHSVQMVDTEVVVTVEAVVKVVGTTEPPVVMLLVTGQVVTVTYVTTVVSAPGSDGEPAEVDGAGVVPGVVPGVSPGPVGEGVGIAGLDDTGATDEGGVGEVSV